MIKEWESDRAKSNPYYTPSEGKVYVEVMTSSDVLVHSAGPSETDVRKRLALEEEEELKQSKEPLPEGCTRVKYLHTGLDLEESQ